MLDRSVDGDPTYVLVTLLALAMAGLVVAVIRDRSAGADRRDARQRRARRRERAERRAQREIEETMPRATVVSPRDEGD